MNHKRARSCFCVSLPAGARRGKKVPDTFCRDGFTLFELILAVALSAALLTLIGTAINLYLMRVDASRSRVEEAQLARSILAMIARDIRATTIYEPQDTSAMAALLASSRTADNGRDDRDDDDSSGGEQPGGTIGTDSTGSPGSAYAVGPASGSGDDGPSSGSASGSNNDHDDEEVDGTLSLGLNGTLPELYVDVTRLPSREELFATITGYTNAPMPLPAGSAASAAATTVPPSDLKTVRYFIRQGERIDASTMVAMSVPPDQKQLAGGLVRQEIPRAARTFAEQSGNAALLESGQVLVAPEVVHLEFHYYDGQQVRDVWDMQEAGSLPLAVEVRIWLLSTDAADSSDATRYDPINLMANAREYRQTVYLPMSADVSSGGGFSGQSSASSSDSSSSGSDSDSRD